VLTRWAVSLIVTAEPDVMPLNLCARLQHTLDHLGIEELPAWSETAPQRRIFWPQTVVLLPKEMEPNTFNKDRTMSEQPNPCPSDNDWQSRAELAERYLFNVISGLCRDAGDAKSLADRALLDTEAAHVIVGYVLSEQYLSRLGRDPFAAPPVTAPLEPAAPEQRSFI
jgi:hypothetical protein